MASNQDALAEFLTACMEVESTSGAEAPFARWLGQRLEAEGWKVTLSPLPGESAEKRLNLWAHPAGTTPRAPVVLCTHMDTVPPHIPPSREGDLVRGRGSCDAKGQIVAMVEASRRVRERGITNVGLLFVAGEETDHAGAAAIGDLGLAGLGLQEPPALVVIGEPTCSRFVKAQKGTLCLRLEARGKAAHSAYPERGESATEHLLDGLALLRAEIGKIAVDPDLGATTANIGILQGGVATNVIPAAAHALVMLRTTSHSLSLAELLHSKVVGDTPGPLALTTERSSDPQRLMVPAGANDGPRTDVVAFNTDAAWLRPLDAPLALFGPGDIEVAHGKDEHISLAELEAAVDVLVNVIEASVKSSPSEGSP